MLDHDIMIYFRQHWKIQETLSKAFEYFWNYYGKMEHMQMEQMLHFS